MEVADLYDKLGVVAKEESRATLVSIEDNLVKADVEKYKKVFFNLFYRSIVDLQCCGNFCCAASDSVTHV